MDPGPFRCTDGLRRGRQGLIMTGTILTRGAGFFTGEHHIRYYSETGSARRFRSTYAESTTRTRSYAMALLVNDTTRRLSCTLEIIAVHVDLRSRTAAAFASDTAAAIDRELATTAVNRPAPICGAMRVRR
jgi:acyl-CoA thioester hydrolase